MDFTKFNETFFRDSGMDIRWFNDTGLVKLSNGLMAEIRISRKGTSGQYEQYIVSIQNKEGEVASKRFVFTDYLGGDNNSCTNQMCIIDHCCRDGIADWYIQKPSRGRVELMANEIAGYISLYGSI